MSTKPTDSKSAGPGTVCSLAPAPCSAPPDAVWLQWDGDQEPDYYSEHGGVTWAAHKIFKHDVEYLRAHRLREMADDALNSFRIQGKPVPEEVRKLLTMLLPNVKDEPRRELARLVRQHEA